MIETCRLKNVVIFIKTILSFALSRKIINISFYFRLFPRKTNDKIFEKIQKELFWDHHGPFLTRSGQKVILLDKRALSVFKYSIYLSSCKKSEKNWWLIHEKNPKLIDGHRKTGNDDYTGPFVGPGSNKHLKDSTMHNSLWSIAIKNLHLYDIKLS